MKRFITLLFLSISLVACRKDGPPADQQTNIHIDQGSGVYIVNEGNYQFGNAKVGYFNLSKQEAIIDVFQQTNGKPLGDVCQSMYIFQHKAYLVVNNSGKIEVCQTGTLKSTATITGLASPRYFLPVSNSKAYVSDLYSNAISIVDLVQNIKTGSIPCKGWTEGMALIYGQAFVTNIRSNYLYIVNTSTDQLVDSIPLRVGGNSIQQDKNGKLWVLCYGDKNNDVKAALYRIDPLSRNVELTLPFQGTDESVNRLSINGTNDTLYFLNKGVCQFPITATTLPSPLIAQGGKNFYGMGIDPHNSLIYVSDAIDYVQQGKVYVYQPNGNLVTSFATGIIPGGFCFP
jgi:hypothetical protein